MPFCQIALMAENSTGLQAADYVVVLLYLAGVVGVGVYFSRQQREGEDYFVARRRMPWYAVGLSLVASLLSTLTYLGAPGELIKNGIAQSVGWIVLPFAFAVISLMWLPFFMRMRLTSVYEYLGQRFGLAARWVGVVLFVFILRLGWMAVIILTASKAVAQITYGSAMTLVYGELSRSEWMTQSDWTLAVLLSVGILATIYTVLGGIKAVIWTDVAQFVVLFAGAVLTVVFIASKTGTGPLDWWRTATSGDAEGHEFPPLASWDLSERTTILWTCMSGFFWYICTYTSDQVAMQRYFTTPSVRSAIWANVVNFAADLAVMVLLALCGMALLTYYLDPQFQTEIVAGITDPRHPQVADRIFPHFIEHGLPVGVSGLVVAALFAVAMSSLDSGMNSVSTVLTVDVFRRFRPNMSARGELFLARVLTLIIGVGCTCLALPMLNLPDEYNIVDVTLKTFNCALGPLAAMFMAGMFLSHVGQRAVVIASVCGLAIAGMIAWWSHIVWQLGLTNATTLKAAIDAGPSSFLVTPIAMTLTFLIAAVLGALLPQPDLERVRSLTWRAVVFGKHQRDDT